MVTVENLGLAVHHAHPYLNGEPIGTDCFALDEFEGWADVYLSPRRLVGQDEIAHTRLYGDVELRIRAPR